MKMKKLITFGIILIIIMLLFSTFVYADINPNDYKTSPSLSGNSTVMKFSKRVVSVINLIGIITLIATVGILGIKYMVSSVEERAEYKKNMMPLLIGAILLFSLSTIIRIVYNIFG